MATEASKFRKRWEADGTFDRYFKDKKVLDIGCGNDLIVPWADGFDKKEGDGTWLHKVPDNSYDIVFSSHFLEHVADPQTALLNQWRVLRDQGYLICLVPDEDLYEQGVWPSKFNADHKFTYTVHKHYTWSPSSRNLLDLIVPLANHKLISARIIDTGYDYARQVIEDQSNQGAEVCCEVVVQKASVQLGLQPSLKTLLQCPSCKHASFLLRGIKEDKSLEGYCTFCSVSGTWDLKNLGL